MNKLIVILGPTSSGKSTLAIKLARKFNGEIISADSRQVYKGLDIGTGKVPISRGLRSKTLAKSRIPSKDGIYSGGIPHHLLDIVSPKKQYTVANFKNDVKCAIAQITSQGKIPFLVGGTAFYIYAAIDDWSIPKVKPNLKLRKALEKKSTKELFIVLKNIDPTRAKTIDKKNRRRLIRAIEINIVTGKPVPSPVILNGVKDLTRDSSASPQNDNNVLILGIKKSQKELYKLINKRLNQRLKQGLVSEVKKLHKQGLSYKRLNELGLEYRFVAKYLKKEITYNDMVSKLKTAIHQFSKRQMTWWKKDNRIKWISNQNQAEKCIKDLLLP
jgi:tRNA dimethylallyltransferase